MKKFVSGVAAAALFLGAAQAATIDTSGTFADFLASGPGVHGVELRGGDGNGAATWEAGVGTQTSNNASTFNQGQVDWTGGDTAGNRIAEDFLFTMSATGQATFTISRGGSTISSVSFSGLSLGNALAISVKRLAELSIDTINGSAISFDLGDYTTDSSFDEIVLFDPSFTNGFTIGGTLDIDPIRMRNGNAVASNSFSGINFKTGNVDAIPVPAAAFLFAPFAAAPLLRRLRKAHG